MTYATQWSVDGTCRQRNRCKKRGCHSVTESVHISHNMFKYIIRNQNIVADSLSPCVNLTQWNLSACLSVISPKKWPSLALLPPWHDPLWKLLVYRESRIGRNSGFSLVKQNVLDCWHTHTDRHTRAYTHTCAHTDTRAHIHTHVYAHTRTKCALCTHRRSYTHKHTHKLSLSFSFSSHIAVHMTSFSRHGFFHNT